ncbi:Alpha/beta hydrolase family protein [Mycolicibacterium rutilum]|uniref:Alpha/beta hydrolase family protein n=1 Tax=Mycolicibacterium rutilum TaxID=370526 RepID=A0A1H6LCW6_MYCRU|nr:alpha/beta hydrolase [Mycolicibacterium rutilum]SEH83043.1 Alpha/beta hydrolase family protein [Mycolicibacterium rutilum]
MRRWLSVLLALLALAACSAPPGAAQPDADPVGAVDIGGGRQLYLQCQGHGSPTVFVIPGKGSYAEVWNVVIPPDDPIRSSPYDIVERARFVATPDAVQPTVARTTRVCAYDRPDTRPDGPDRSTPVRQPHTVAQDVDDLVALLAAAHLAGPFVFAAHSYGGLILDLLARTRPDLVAGIVMVDGVSEFLMTLGSPAQNAAFERDAATPPEPGDEAVLMTDAFARIHAAPPLPRVPAIVLSVDKFAAPEALTPDNYTLAQIHTANDLLAAELGTTNVIATGSGHNVMLYQPKFVSDNIIAVVDRVRAGA